MFTIHDLEDYFGKTQIEVNGLTFNLIKDESMAGVLALWQCTTPDNSIVVYATPDWEDIAVSVEAFDDESQQMGCGCEIYEHEIHLFEDYIDVVKVLLKRILDKHMGILETIYVNND